MGIDGSDAAVNAAKWAVSEAISRDVPLRLVHAIPQREPAGAADDDRLDIEYGQTVLRAACAAVNAMGRQVKVETDLVHGPPGEALVVESTHAAMICLGSIGIEELARRIIGSTVITLAEQAHCPVAIIRHNRAGKDPRTGWIAVVVDDSAENDAVLGNGFREARLRDAPILAMGVWRWGLGEIPYDQLDRRLGRWVSEYPEVHVLPAAARGGAAAFLASTPETIQLAVIAGSDADDVARIVGPINAHFGHPGCSVLVVRT
ncbi:universal stress protein [Mycobacterium sherrisii]|uniref:universal stress protein n=1 Tax=Mycobacterium sherrisii TaxID=243061 RepID=UPI0011523220|nr:universal stress protein [Mycobacterium sherrisii]